MDVDQQYKLTKTLDDEIKIAADINFENETFLLFGGCCMILGLLVGFLLGKFCCKGTKRTSSHFRSLKGTSKGPSYTSSSSNNSENHSRNNYNYTASKKSIKSNKSAISYKTKRSSFAGQYTASRNSAALTTLQSFGRDREPIQPFTSNTDLASNNFSSLETNKGTFFNKYTKSRSSGNLYEHKINVNYFGRGSDDHEPENESSTPEKPIRSPIHYNHLYRKRNQSDIYSGHEILRLDQANDPRCPDQNGDGNINQTHTCSDEISHQKNQETQEKRSSNPLANMQLTSLRRWVDENKTLDRRSTITTEPNLMPTSIVRDLEFSPNIGSKAQAQLHQPLIPTYSLPVDSDLMKNLSPVYNVRSDKIENQMKKSSTFDFLEASNNANWNAQIRPHHTHNRENSVSSLSMFDNYVIKNTHKQAGRNSRKESGERGRSVLHL